MSAVVEPISNVSEVKMSDFELEVVRLMLGPIRDSNEPVSPLLSVLHEVIKERDRQDAKWGVQAHDPFRYLAILGEEVGEANQAALESYNWKEKRWNHKRLRTEYRTELIQVAAVAVAMVQCLDLDQWTRGRRVKIVNPDGVLDGQMPLEESKCETT